MLERLPASAAESSSPLHAIIENPSEGLLLNKHNQEPSRILSVIESTTADKLVISGLGSLLINEMETSHYLHPNCYTLFTSRESVYNYLNAIQEWRNMDMIVLIDCSKAILTFDRMRLLEKVSDLVNHDVDFLRLITSFCNLPILDPTIGKHVSIQSGIPPVSFIGEVLFNIIISDMDKEVTS